MFAEQTEKEKNEIKEIDDDYNYCIHCGAIFAGDMIDCLYCGYQTH